TTIPPLSGPVVTACVTEDAACDVPFEPARERVMSAVTATVSNSSTISTGRVSRRRRLPAAPARPAPARWAPPWRLAARLLGCPPPGAAPWAPPGGPGAAGSRVAASCSPLPPGGKDPPAAGWYAVGDGW